MINWYICLSVINFLALIRALVSLFITFTSVFFNFRTIPLYPFRVLIPSPLNYPPFPQRTLLQLCSSEILSTWSDVIRSYSQLIERCSSSIAVETRQPMRAQQDKRSNIIDQLRSPNSLSLSSATSVYTWYYFQKMAALAIETICYWLKHAFSSSLMLTTRSVYVFLRRSYSKTVCFCTYRNSSKNEIINLHKYFW